MQPGYFYDTVRTAAQRYINRCDVHTDVQQPMADRLASERSCGRDIDARRGETRGGNLAGAMTRVRFCCCHRWARILINGAYAFRRNRAGEDEDRSGEQKKPERLRSGEKRLVAAREEISWAKPKDEKRRSGTTTKPVLIIIFIFRHDGANPPPRSASCALLSPAAVSISLPRGFSLERFSLSLSLSLPRATAVERDGIDIAV